MGSRSLKKRKARRKAALDALRAIGFGKLERLFIRADQKTAPYFDPEKLRVWSPLQ